MSGARRSRCVSVGSSVWHSASTPHASSSNLSACSSILLHLPSNDRCDRIRGDAPICRNSTDAKMALIIESPPSSQKYSASSTCPQITAHVRRSWNAVASSSFENREFGPFVKCSLSTGESFKCTCKSSGSANGISFSCVPTIWLSWPKATFPLRNTVRPSPAMTD